MGLKMPWFPEDIVDWLEEFKIKIKYQAQKDAAETYISPTELERAQRVDEVLAYFEKHEAHEDEKTMRNTELVDIQQYCETGTFPARGPPYEGAVSFYLCFRLGKSGGYLKGNENIIALSPDKCKTVRDLKDYIKDKFKQRYGEKVVLDGATLRADNAPNVQLRATLDISIDDDRKWQWWRERNLVYGRVSRIMIGVTFVISENPQLNSIFDPEDN